MLRVNGDVPLAGQAGRAYDSLRVSHWETLLPALCSWWFVLVASNHSSGRAVKCRSPGAGMASLRGGGIPHPTVVKGEAEGTAWAVVARPVL